VDKRETLYWGATGLACAALGLGGLGDLLHVEPLREEIVRLGYPEFLLTILGIAKLSGVATLLTPGLPRLKEWAYAGFTFELLGATASHAFVGDPLLETIRPTLVLLLVATSYLAAPESRHLGEPIALSPAARNGVGS